MASIVTDFDVIFDDVITVQKSAEVLKRKFANGKETGSFPRDAETLAAVDVIRKKGPNIYKNVHSVPILEEVTISGLQKAGAFCEIYDKGCEKYEHSGSAQLVDEEEPESLSKYMDQCIEVITSVSSICDYAIGIIIDMNLVKEVYASPEVMSGKLPLPIDAIS